MEKTLILNGRQYKGYKSSEEKRMTKNEAYVGEGVVLEVTLNKNIKSIEVK